MPLRSVLSATAIAVLSGRPRPAALSRVVPARAIEIPLGPLAAALACPARLSVPGLPGRPRAARGAPADCVPVAVIRIAADSAPRIGHIIDVFAVVCTQVPQGEKHDNKDQDDNCCQADHDLGHRTIQRGMA